MTELGIQNSIFVPVNLKILDINESDTSPHIVNISTPLSETRKILAITLMGNRVGGTGSLRVYPNEGSQYSTISSMTTLHLHFIKEGLQRLQYSQSVASDDWDVYCFGYVVEG